MTLQLDEGTSSSGCPEQAGAPGAHGGGVRPGRGQSAGLRSRETEGEAGAGQEAGKG